MPQATPFLLEQGARRKWEAHGGDRVRRANALGRRAADDKIHLAAVAGRAARTARPIDNGSIGAVARELIRDGGLGPLSAPLAPHDQPYLGSECRGRERTPGMSQFQCNTLEALALGSFLAHLLDPCGVQFPVLHLANNLRAKR